MELGTWEEAGHTSKASKVWATGGILIAWEGGAQEQALQFYAIKDTDQSRKNTHISHKNKGGKLRFDKKHKFTMLPLNQAT